MRTLSRRELADQVNAIAAEDIFDEQALARCSLVEFSDGEQVLAAGDRLESVLVITEGVAQICSLSSEGRLVTVAEAEAPQLLGDIEYLSGEPVLHGAYARGKLRAISIPPSVLEGTCQDSLAFYRLICANLVKKLRRTSYEYSRALLYPARVRLARWLIGHADGTGVATIRGVDVADELGITPRHLSRLIGELVGEGILERTAPKRLAIRRAALLEELAYSQT